MAITERATKDSENAVDPAFAPRQLMDLWEAPDIGGIPCRMAGLWLLLPALRLIGAETAEAELQFPFCQSLMRVFAGRLGLPDTAPVYSVLDQAVRAEPATANGHWGPHESVVRLLAGRRGLFLSRTFPGRAALGFRRGPPGFAQLDADNLRQIRKAGVLLHRRPAGRPVSTQDVHLSLILAMQRLVTGLTGRGWRSLVRRPGRVLIKPSHIDITYDGRDVDPAVRLAGLDIDPGWVPWLGRVVSFHYDYSKVRDVPPPGRPR